jgi:chromosome segregation ATPase
MTKVDDILEELRKGTPPEVIRKKYRSWGQQSEAFGIYLTELAQEVKKKQNQLLPLTSKIQELQDKIKSLETHEKQLKDSIVSLESEHRFRAQKTTEEIARHKQELDKLQEVTNERRSELEELNLKLSDLSKKGNRLLPFSQHPLVLFAAIGAALILGASVARKTSG